MAQHQSDERVSANQLRQILAGQMSENSEQVNLQIPVDDKPTTIALHRSLSELLLELLRVVGAGDAVILLPVHQQLTTQQAADILNVSRPYLIKLLEQGEMDYQTVGRHRRVLARDDFVYKQKMAGQRDEALSELALLDADLIRVHQSLYSVGRRVFVCWHSRTQHYSVTSPRSE